MDLPITERGELIRKTGRIGDLPLALVNKIWRITGTRRARARWNRLKDYFKRLFILDHWLYWASTSPSLWFDGEPQSFYQQSQNNRNERLSNFWKTMKRQIEGWQNVGHPKRNWQDPAPMPNVPPLITFSDFGI